MNYPLIYLLTTSFPKHFLVHSQPYPTCSTMMRLPCARVQITVEVLVAATRITWRPSKKERRNREEQPEILGNDSK